MHYGHIGQLMTSTWECHLNGVVYEKACRFLMGSEHKAVRIEPLKL